MGSVKTMRIYMADNVGICAPQFRKLGRMGTELRRARIVSDPRNLTMGLAFLWDPPLVFSR